MKTVKIKNRIIGEGYPAYIIAEMSGNHAGSISRAKEIIHMAKECGADCIKLQTYTPDTITIDCDNEYFRIHQGTWSGENLYRLYGKAFTPWEWQVELKEEAKKAGIDFFSTPFDCTAVDFLEEIGVEFYKIASFELVDIPLIKYVASKGKPIIMSTGMGTLGEIEEAVNAVQSQGNNDLILLKCSSAYPSIPKDMNLKTLKNMSDIFGLPVGFSDHSMGSLGAVTAVALGACIIEKHVCMNREIENPDASFSMEPAELKQLVEDIRNAEMAIGNISYSVSKKEKESRIFRKSIFAVRDIEKGNLITTDNIRVIRPGYGLLPKFYESILGKVALEDIKRGTPLSINMIGKNRDENLIIFLTNNCNTDDLYQWIKERENVMRYEEPLDLETVVKLSPWLILSYNYGFIIPEEVIRHMEHRIINLHISLLPWNKGSNPNFWSFIENTPKGVTIHQMDKGLDTGDILLQKAVEMEEEKETFRSSYEKLNHMIQELLKANWDGIKNGTIIARKQDGKGSYHTLREFREKVSNNTIDWDENIAEFKKRVILKK